MTETRVNDPESSQRAREIARAALDGEHGLLLACRDLAALRPRLPCVPDDAFDALIAVASEVDDLPIGSERRHWATKVLKAKDADAKAYEERVGPAIRTALERLLTAL